MPIERTGTKEAENRTPLNRLKSLIVVHGGAMDDAPAPIKPIARRPFPGKRGAADSPVNLSSPCRNAHTSIDKKMNDLPCRRSFVQTP